MTWDMRRAHRLLGSPSFAGPLGYAMGAVLAVQAIGLGAYGAKPPGVFLSDFAEFAASLLACASAFAAYWRARGAARAFWGLVSTAFAMWAVGQADWIYYKHGLHTQVPRISLAWAMFRSYSAPFALALALGQNLETRRVDWQRLLDLMQAGIVILLFYVDTDWGAGLHLPLLNSPLLDVAFAMNPLNWFLPVAGILRARYSTSFTFRQLWARMTVYLFVYAAGAALANSMLGTWEPAPGSWLELSWTIPFLLAAAIAAGWEQPAEEIPPARRPVGPVRPISILLPASLPLAVMFLALFAGAEARVVTLAAVALSVILYGARLALSQYQQQQNVAALWAAQERYRSLFEKNLAGVFRSTPDGRFVDCNEAFARIFGYASRDEVLKLPAAAMYFDPAARTSRLELLRRQGHLSNEEVCLRRKNGSAVWVLQNVALLADENSCEVIEWTIVDITDRKVLEQQLQQSQKMEAIGRLAGGVAHDFNNLLGVILGYGELLLEKLTPGDPLRGNVEEIQEAGARASSLTQQLLAFSRQQVMETKVLDLAEIVAAAEKLLQRLIGEDIELIIAPVSRPVPIKADPGQIQQVILNLAINSRDAMPHGGKLIIEAAVVELDEEYAGKHPGVRPGRFAVLALSDTGIGMDAETQGRIFEPFFTTKEKGKGTGLGLATVYGIVKQSGGHIWCYSEPGHGTTFKTYLPLAEGEIPASAPAPGATGSLAGAETILLVEDEEALRNVTREFLRTSGYTVLEASRGSDALEIARRHKGPIHLVLTDVVLPGMSGRALSEALVQVRTQCKTLYVSGYTDDAIVQHGVLEHGVAFLQKPFARETLLRKVREVLEKA